jgi:hypothetical protein
MKLALFGPWTALHAIHGPFRKKRAICICQLSNTPLSQPFRFISSSVLVSRAARDCLRPADALCLDMMRIIHMSRGWASWRWRERWTDSHLVTLAMGHRVENRCKWRKSVQRVNINLCTVIVITWNRLHEPEKLTVAEVVSTFPAYLKSDTCTI